MRLWESFYWRLKKYFFAKALKFEKNDYIFAVIITGQNCNGVPPGRSWFGFFLLHIFDRRCFRFCTWTLYKKSPAAFIFLVSKKKSTTDSERYCYTDNCLQQQTKLVNKPVSLNYKTTATNTDWVPPVAGHYQVPLCYILSKPAGTCQWNKF